jgi:flagellar assembly factor FliW
MKVSTESFLPGTGLPPLDGFTLPQGIVGFADYTRAELQRDLDQLPFMRMKLFGPKGCINFVVIEPCGLVDGYEPELFDNDASSLRISEPSDAMILLIITMRHGTPVEATVNLIGPLVINRITGIGRQLVIANYSKYRARHPLIESSSTATGSA